MVNLWLMMVDDSESISGWWLSHPSEKDESHLALSLQIYGKIKVMFQTTNQQKKASGVGNISKQILKQKQIVGDWYHLVK